MMGAPPAMMGEVAVAPPPAVLGQVPVQPMMGKIAVPEKMGDYRMPTDEDASGQ
jgi:hypothetical protein